MPDQTPAALGAISAVYKIGHGISQTADANKRALVNRRPDYNIQQEYYDNQNIAENQAGQGFTSKTVDNYNTQTERGLQATIDATLQGGGGPNAIQGAFGAYNLGNRNFAAADAEKQTENIRALYDRNKDLAGQKTQQWVLDKYKPFQDEAAAIAQEKNAGQQNISTGISEGIATAASVATAGVNASMLGGAGGAAKGATEPAIGSAMDEPFNIRSMGERFQPGYFDTLKNTIPSSSMESDYTTWLQNQETPADTLPGGGSSDDALSPAETATLRKLLNRVR